MWEEVKLPKIGKVVAFTSEKGVCALYLGINGENALRRFQEECGDSMKFSCGIIKYASVLSSLREYAMGWRTTFDLPLHFLTGTMFQKSVWQILRRIPYGKCVSYQWVAQRVGRPKAVRAVGNAVAKNPIPIFVPCHRVIHKDGTLGGFSAGISLKKVLLEIEKCGLKIGGPR